MQPSPLPNHDLKPTGPQVRPWVRFFARSIDMFAFSAVAGFTVGFLYTPASRMNEYVFGIMLSIIYIFLEPIMLSTWGATPGKALLNISLRREDGSKLSYSEGLNRSFHVWLKGCGAGVPIVALFTQLRAYNRLKNEGKTSWDREGHYVYIHHNISPVRIIVTVLLIACFLILAVIGKHAP